MLISKDELDALKVRHELSAFISSSGMELKKQGAYLVARCPFHSPDKTPSLIVDPRKQLWNCLGACRTNGKSGGDVIAFAMKLWGLDFRATVERLGGVVKKELPPPRKRRDNALARADHALGSARADRATPEAAASGPPALSKAALVSRAVARMHEELSVTPKAQEWLESRGLKTRALWRAFNVGYSSGSIEDLAGTEAEEARRILIEAGILSDAGKERMRGRVVFPLVAFNQLPVNLYGRAINGSEPYHLFLPGPKRGLFNWNAARRAKELLAVESVICALSLVEAGVGNAIPLYGISGLTEDHKELVRRCGVTSVVVGLDADEAGHKAAPGVAAAFEALGVRVRIIEWPEKDPNEVLVKHGPAKLREIVEKILREPKPAPNACTSSPVGRFAQEKLSQGAASNAREPAPEAALCGVVSEAVNPLPLTAVTAHEDGHEPAVKEEKLRDAGVEASASTVALEGDELRFPSGPRLYHVRGVATAAKGGAALRVRIKLTAGAARVIDAVDLYSPRSRGAFLTHAVAAGAGERGEIESDLLKLVERIEEAETQAQAQKVNGAPGPKPLEMSEGQRQEASAFLRAPDLLDRAASDMTRLGYVGEKTNKEIGYLVSVSRKLDAPLSMIVMSQSGSGKSALAEVLEQLTPPEDVILFSRLTPQALFYMERNALQKKFILIEERAGSMDADYSIRILQSKKRLVLALPIKDPSTGKTQTQVFEILGPAAFLETTTESRINPENASRCFEVFCDESEEQTRRIHEAQKLSKTAEGRALLAERDAILRRHQNAQRLLENVRVEIPYAPLLTFPSAWLRTRRDHLRFLNLIETIAFLYQHQRVKKTDGNGIAYIEATADDYERAYNLAAELLGQTLSDAKRPALDFYEKVRGLAERAATGSHKRPEDVPLTRREIREATGLPDHRLRALLSELVDLEYLEIVAGNQGRTYRYRLASPAPQAQARLLTGLLTPGELRARPKEKR